MRTLCRLGFTALIFAATLGKNCCGCTDDHWKDSKIGSDFNRSRLVSLLCEEDDSTARCLLKSWKSGKKMAEKSAQTNKGYTGQFPNFPIILYGLNMDKSVNLSDCCTSDIERRIFLTNHTLLDALDSKRTSYKDMIVFAAGWDSVAARLNSVIPKQPSTNHPDSNHIVSKRGSFMNLFSCDRYSNVTIGIGIGLALMYGALSNVTISCGTFQVTLRRDGNNTCQLTI
ncbi:MAG: hypothetical protein LBJ77_03165 [Holosporales bacterium]|jgi:hypothetical protein|nr:hypothetical protein [Holosporales bacterium]